MMGKSHALCGLIFGVGVAAALPYAPLPVRLLVIPVAGGAALLPDIDHPSSRVARSLGPVTKVLAHGVSALSLAVYHATRTERDVADRKSGHRALTHTAPGCLMFGVIVGFSVLVHPIAGTITLGLLTGLLAQGFKSLGVGFTVAGGALAWWALTHCPSWTWVWPVVVFGGALVHVIAGDFWTNSGVPLWWPLVREGRRWGLVRAPATFSTGSPVESHVVTPMLFVLLFVSGVFASGVVPALARAFA